MNQINHPTAEMFLLPTSRGIEVIIINTIVRIEASSNYSRLYFSNGNILVVAKTLGWFEEKLCHGDFFRTHKTHLVNKHFIMQYRTGKVKLVNGECIDVSKRKQHFFLKSWMGSI
jgi:two-component system, LytTR family, response regulator